MMAGLLKDLLTVKRFINMSKLISLEGCDGCGKGTHIKWIADHLRSMGKNVLITREPGGTPVAEVIRSLLLTKDMSLLTETLLFAAARKDHLERVIIPNLENGFYVICDRYIDSTIAYQCGARGLDVDISNQLMDIIDVRVPDLTLLFDLDTKVAQSRMADRTLDRFELEGEAFQQVVRNAYLDLAHDNPRFKVIDSGKTIPVIRNELEHILNDFIE